MTRTSFDRRSILGLGAAALTASALAACGGGSDTGTTSDPAGGSGARATEGTIDNDGILRIGATVATSNVFPENFNVFGGGDSAPGNALFWETLFRISSTDGSKLAPNLAESVEYTEGGKVATYVLRDDVTWNDGEKFTSKDVAFTYGFIFEEPGTTPDENGNLPWLAKAIETPDEKTVVVTYNEPQYTEDLPLSLYFPIYPEHIYKDLDRQNYQDRDPVGTGPGRLKKFAGQQIEIEIRDDYWGEIAPELTEVHLVPSGTAGNIESQITKGDVDWSQGGAPGVVTNFVTMEDHNGYYYYPDGSTRGIIMATHKGPTQDVAVRRALRAAADMNIVAEAAGIAYTVPSITGLDTGIYASMLKDEFKDSMMPDLEAAKKELADAGWTVNEAGNLEKDGTEHPLKLHIQNDNPAEMTTMPIVVDQWSKNLGLKVAFTPLPPDVFGPAQAKGDYELSLWTTNAAGGAFQAFTMYMHTKIYEIGDETADGNYGRWKMPDAANDAIMAITTTPPDQVEKITENCQILQQAVADEAPYIPVQSNGAGGMFTTKKWSGLKEASDIDYFPRVDGYNNLIRTVTDFTPSKA
ncbi:transcriptional initiation protein Tat [Brachybacterium phenoliresistens]|uniref:Transcriptional initiation protein Tat n=2 Tax=Brachybacterium phenoliresistens TaxID=396014 RepID=Z9JWV5_9MICO|nr:transcriptional initiation protein Tat [Brachybacterium phenoliresistens]